MGNNRRSTTRDGPLDMGLDGLEPGPDTARSFISTSSYDTDTARDRVLREVCLKNAYVCTYLLSFNIHTCIRRYIHTCIRRYIPACIRRYVRTYMYLFFLSIYYLSLLNTIGRDTGLYATFCGRPPRRRNGDSRGTSSGSNRRIYK